jgi:hypothetical protein
MAFEARASVMLIPAAQEWETFGGAYFEQRNRGRLVVQVTVRDPEAEGELLKLSPEDRDLIEFREVAIAYRDLEDALLEAREIWHEVADARFLPAVGIDEPSSSIRFHVLAADHGWASGMSDELEERLQVPISFEIAEPDRTAACTSRDNCWDPVLKGGARIYLGGIQNPVALCTMGFHITTSQADEQFLTAGHCDYGSSFHSWYHNVNFGLIGNVGANLHSPGGFDIERVHMPDARASEQIIDVRPLVGATWPSHGQHLCSSLGNSDPPAPDCGQVTDGYFGYVSPGGCNCLQYGGDVDFISIIVGDSGSPLVVYNSPSTSLAVGIVATSGGKFARVQDALSTFNSTVYVP